MKSRKIIRRKKIRRNKTKSLRVGGSNDIESYNSVYLKQILDFTGTTIDEFNDFISNEKNKNKDVIVDFFKRKHELKYKRERREFQLMIKDDNFDAFMDTIVLGRESSLFEDQLQIL